MKPEDVISNLRSQNDEDRRRALEAVFGDETRAVLLLISAESAGMVLPRQVDPRVLFSTLVWAAQQLGDACGLDLHWVTRQPEQDRILVPGKPSLLR